MQRAVASTPSDSGTNTPSTPTGPPAKRQRLSNGKATPTTPSDQELINKALAEEELKRAQAIERQAAEAGETRWVLNFEEDKNTPTKNFNVVNAGYGELDAQDNAHKYQHGENGFESSSPMLLGRRSFGKFKDPDIVTKDDVASDESSSSDDGLDYDDNDDPMAAMVRQERKAATQKARAERQAKSQAAKAEGERLAQERRNKAVKLNKLTSISGGGNAGSPFGKSQIECFKCGQKGHTKKECPKNNGNGNGRRR